jgi:predicted DNA-binding protein (UPF0251 family)
MPRKPAKPRRHPRDVRSSYPAVRDADFRDAISTVEAAEIMGISDTYVRRLLREGRLEGKVLTEKAYLVSAKAARENAAEYRRSRGGVGRPRSGA